MMKDMLEKGTKEKSNMMVAIPLLHLSSYTTDYYHVLLSTLTYKRIF